MPCAKSKKTSHRNSLSITLVPKTRQAMPLRHINANMRNLWQLFCTTNGYVGGQSWKSISRDLIRSGTPLSQLHRTLNWNYASTMVENITH